jgi:NADH dehydrogenase
MARPRIVIVGAGFAGFHAARELCRLARGRADVVIVNPTDYFLYLPLLPEVAAGLLDPRDVTVSLPATVPQVRLVLAEATSIDLARRRVHYRDAEGADGALSYHRLVIALGSVNRLLPVPGVAEHAHGFRGIPEALYLRDHMTRQLELADATDDPFERAARTTFVVVGAGYTGTEVAAHGVVYTDILYQRHPRLWDYRPRWHLIDVADRVLPELSSRLSATAEVVLRQRGVDIRTGTTVEEATGEGVRLSDGTTIDTRTLIWCVGVRPDPLVADLGLATMRDRLLVDEFLSVPGHPEVYACGDAAAVPDLTRPSEITTMTAQHAVRQGRQVARNIAASYGTGRRRPYRHHDLGFVVDLGGTKAAANPLRLPLAGLPAKTVTRAYHLLSLPGNRIRTATEWLLDAILPRQTVQLGLVRSPAVPLDTERPELPSEYGRRFREPDQG